MQSFIRLLGIVWLLLFPLIGNSTEQKPLTLESLISKAESGDVESMNMLGVVYYEGKSMPKNIQKSAHWFELAAQKKHAMASYNLAMMYLSGEITGKQDPVKAMMYFKQSASAGYALAAYQIGEMYRLGIGVGIKSDAKARPWYEKAAAGGNELAKKQLAQSNRPSSQSDNSNKSEDFNSLLHRAETGEANAQQQLALSYEKTGDMDSAVKWFEAAAKQDAIISQLKLGFYYLNQKQYDKALYWYRLAESKRNEEAINQLDTMYEQRLVGVPTDEKGELEWYLARAKQGDRNAQFQLYQLYQYRGDKNASAEWLAEAQENGHPRAIALDDSGVTPQQRNAYLEETMRRRNQRMQAIGKDLNSFTGKQVQQGIYQNMQSQ